MPTWRRPDLAAGIYDEVVSDALRRQLDRLGESHEISVEELGETTGVDEQLVAMVRDGLRVALGCHNTTLAKLELAQRLLEQLETSKAFRPGETSLEANRLLRISPRFAGQVAPVLQLPKGSLLESGLITNGHNDSVLSHLTSEFDSADRVDLLCSFIKLSGLDRFRPLIERHRARGRPVRVLTTTYMRATEARAIELLHRLGAEVRISYDDSTTRLHAKAWLFGRDSEYSTAYVGSSNLSHAAQTEGLEWNVRITQTDQPALVEEVRNLFESYWQDADRFEPFDGSPAAISRLAGALTEPDSGFHQPAFDLEPKEWQKPILRELVEARALGRSRNLVVAATGTGKTLIAAFDYERLRSGGKGDTLLFVAHRREILEQSRHAFRNVLGLPSFGELLVDGARPSDFRHVFASVQSLGALEELPSEHFSHVIVDEVHHAAARTYDELLSRLKPVQLVGLTATPERADGLLYEKHFPKPYIGNLRVWDAIQQQVLVPFRFFVLDVEGLDLSAARWEGGYVDSELSQRLITAQEFWVRAIVRALRDRIARPSQVRALAFCVDQAHARVVAERFNRDTGLKARALTAQTPAAERARAKQDLTSGAVQVLCVVDLFNEGVDIPDVNTLFILRPTESATVFLQQLGRGLRRSRNKDILTVFDVTGRQHQKFRFDRNLRALLNFTPRELRVYLESGSGPLPSGCVLDFEERSQKEILDRVRHAIPTNWTELTATLSLHGGEGWDLVTFLRETEVSLEDLYKSKKSWTALQASAGLRELPTPLEEGEALGNIHKLLHVRDRVRLDAWSRLLGGKRPGTELERRLAAMLLVSLIGKFDSRQLEPTIDRLLSFNSLCAELQQLFPILASEADALPRLETLTPEIPLVRHACYLDRELSAAFAATAQKTGEFRNFYTGVERVLDGRYDLLLVTLDKDDQKHERLRYQDFPISETMFQWQSKAATRVDDNNGRRHLHPVSENVVPLLLVRETKKDSRGVTNAFRFLGPVEPHQHRGERPITIEWKLGTPLQPEWFRKWRCVT